MTGFYRYQQRRIEQTPKATTPSVMFGIWLVVAGVVIAFIVAAHSGPLESRPILAAAPVDPTCVDVEPATATIGLASGTDRKAAPTFGFLVFEPEFTDGGTLTGFGPLPATACVPAEPSTNEGYSAGPSSDGNR